MHKIKIAALSRILRIFNLPVCYRMQVNGHLACEKPGVVQCTFVK